MGPIQGAVNSMLGAVSAGASVVKGMKTAQELAAQKAQKSMQAEIDYKIKQQQLKNMRKAGRVLTAKLKNEKMGGSK